MKFQTFVKDVLEAVLPEPAMVQVRKLHYRRKLKSASAADEPDLTVAVRLLSAGDVAVDCGANYGLYTRFFSEAVGANGRVVAIEPVPSTFAVLSSNVRGLGLSNVTAVNKAVSDHTGSVTMTIPVQSGGKNFYQAHITQDGATEGARSFTVEAGPIDQMVPQGASVRLMKIDVEGHELPCIQGALNLLKKDEPALLIEVSGNPDGDGPARRLVDLLGSVGYRVFGSDGLSLRIRRPGMSRVNYFFLKDAHLARLRQNGVAVHE
jgi:FkbM family methyltransferase